MDIIKKPKKRSLFSKMFFVICGVICVALIVIQLVTQSLGPLRVSRDQLVIEEVRNGDIQVTVSGFGQLISNKQRLITATSDSVVTQIILKPGAQITAGSVIAVLENAELVQKHEDAKQELVQKQANLKQLMLSNKRELLAESANIEEVTAQYEMSALKRKAEERLIKNGIVSQLTFQYSVLNEKQLKKRISILVERVNQLKLVHQEAINVQQEQIKQQIGRLKLTHTHLKKLEVKAEFEGVLQRLSVELGQSLSAGQEIALIGSATDLIANIKVPQNQAQQLVIGQSVTIDTRRDKILGRVSRIDPIVENNTVKVEIALPKVLPLSARPYLDVDGTVLIKTLEKVNYIKRPANLNADSVVNIYQVTDDNSQTKLRTLKFGQKAGHFIEIVSGARKGQRFIISDLSDLSESKTKIYIDN
ncbi:MAG: HlyD family secretion protein [Bacteroidia bacterium]